MRFPKPMLLVLVSSAIVACGPGLANASESASKVSLASGARIRAVSANSSSTSAAAVDDNIPGTPVNLNRDGTLSITGTLDNTSDLDDVYRVFLFAGETYNFSLSGDSGTDFGFFCYGMLATNIYTNDPEVGVLSAHYDGPAAYPRDLNDIAITQTGYYYLDVWNWIDEKDGTSGPSGGYTLTVTCTRPYSDIKFTTIQGTSAYGTRRTVTGTVAGRFTELVGEVFVYYSFDGINYFPYRGMLYDGSTFSFSTLYQTRKTWYTVVFTDYDTVATCAQTVAFSCSAALGSPVAPATMANGRAATLYGFMNPRHTAGTYPVRIYKYRYVSGVWKAYGYVSARASDYSDYTKYSAAVSLPYAGRWRLRAYAPADSQHVATWSSTFDYVTVK